MTKTIFTPEEQDALDNIKDQVEELCHHEQIAPVPIVVQKGTTHVCVPFRKKDGSIWLGIDRRLLHEPVGRRNQLLPVPINRIAHGDLDRPVYTTNQWVAFVLGVAICYAVMVASLALTTPTRSWPVPGLAVGGALLMGVITWMATPYRQLITDAYQRVGREMGIEYDAGYITWRRNLKNRSERWMGFAEMPSMRHIRAAIRIEERQPDGSTVEHELEVATDRAMKSASDVATEAECVPYKWETEDRGQYVARLMGFLALTAQVGHPILEAFHDNVVAGEDPRAAAIDALFADQQE